MTDPTGVAETNIDNSLWSNIKTGDYRCLIIVGLFTAGGLCAKYRIAAIPTLRELFDLQLGEISPHIDNRDLDILEKSLNEHYFLVYQTRDAKGNSLGVWWNRA